MSEGYIYCFGNKSMAGIYKIGMTEKTPEHRLSDANSSDTWRPPTLYTIEFAKRVLNPREKESIIHNILKHSRIHPKREFFNESIERIRLLFDLPDGEYWQPERPTVASFIQTYMPISAPTSAPTSASTSHVSLLMMDSANPNDEDIASTNRIIMSQSDIQSDIQNITEDISDNSENGETSRNVNGCRVMSLCFNNNQRIRHRIRKNKLDESNWVGVYNAREDGILFEGQILTLNQFALRHYASELPKRSRVNAWFECECDVNGAWISTYELPTIR
jgi:hypothetical protein